MKTWIPDAFVSSNYIMRRATTVPGVHEAFKEAVREFDSLMMRLGVSHPKERK